MQCLAILVYIYWCLNLHLPLTHSQFMWNLYFEGWRKFAHRSREAVCDSSVWRWAYINLASIVQQLVPCEGRYPELWWILLVRSNVLNAAQGLVKMWPHLYVIYCDGRCGSFFSLGWALGYAWNFGCWGFCVAMLVSFAGFLADLISL